MTAAIPRSQPGSATHYRDAWRSAIYDATGDYVKTQRAMELAELNGLFDPIDALTTPEEASEPEEISGEEMDLIERNALALIRPEEASTAAGEAVELVRQLREKALWREDVHHDLHIAAANMIEKLAAPPAAQTDGVRERTIEECAKIADLWISDCGHIPTKHLNARDYAVDAVKDIADAIRSLALTCPARQSEEN